MNRPTGLIQSVSRDVRLCLCLSVCLCHFLPVFKRLFTPIYKCHKYNWLIAKRFLREKLGKDIGLRSCDFDSEMVKIAARNMFVVGLCHSLLMDLGHNQEHSA